MPSDPTILAFDTSAAHCAAALLCDGRIAASRSVPMKRGQVEQLMPLLEEMLEAQGMAWSDLDLIAVGIGPGNFTGIRISVSAARGLALGLDIPVMGVSTFEIMRGKNGPADSDQQIVSVEGPRQSLFVQSFEGGRPSTPPTQISLTTAATPNIEHPRPLILGHMAGELARYLDQTEEPHKFAQADLPEFGSTIAEIAFARWQQGEKEPGLPAPLYVRAADAAPPRDTPPVLLD